MSKKLNVKSKSRMKFYLPVVGFCLCVPLDFVVAEVLVDPTRPIDQSKVLSTKQQYTLNAIFIANNRRHVVINGQQISEGGTSGELKVLKIKSNDVLVSIDGKNKILKLHRSMRKNVNEIVNQKGTEVKDKDKSEIVVR